MNATIAVLTTDRRIDPPMVTGRSSGRHLLWRTLRLLERVVLVGTYAATVGAPIILISGAIKPGSRSVLVIFSDALGFLAMTLIALQVFASGRLSASTRAFGLRHVLRWHRRIGIGVVALVIVHVFLLMADNSERLALLDSRSAPVRAKAAMAATLGLIILAITSALRRRLHLSYQAWRWVHLTVTSVILAAAFVHIILVDKFSATPAVRWSMLVLVVASAGSLFWTRIARPYATARRPFRVVDVTPERGDAVTVALVPEGHTGQRFLPGQFVRIRSANSPYGIDDHPFSISSGAHESIPTVTVKALGDYTSRVQSMPPGTRLLLDGPHGEGVHPIGGYRGRLLVAAGIGITPVVSVLRTAAAEYERRPVLLLYGSRRWEDVIFREELDHLAAQLPQARIVHVLSRPGADWRGERGRVGSELVRRHAPRSLSRWCALICGPPTMVAGVQLTLRELGMPSSAIQAEGF